MAIAKTLYPNFSDNGIRVTQAADGSMEITVIPQDPARLVQYVFTVPASSTQPATSTSLTVDSPLAVSNAADFVTNGALPAGNVNATPPTDWPSKIDRAVRRARRAARQATIDAQTAALAALQAEQNADPAPPNG